MVQMDEKLVSDGTGYWYWTGLKNTGMVDDWMFQQLMWQVFHLQLAL